MSSNEPTNPDLNQKLDLILARLERVENKVDSLEQKVDERLHDTRPMWQALNERLDKLENDVKVGFEETGKRLSKIERNIFDMDKRYGQILRDYADLSDRVSDLEEKKH